MAEALGVASSVTALVQNTVTVIGYLKTVKDAPKERDELLNELSDLKHWLSKVEPLTGPLAVRPFTVPAIVPFTTSLSLTMTAIDPWLATMQTLSSPFAQLKMLLDDLKKELEPALTGTGKMKSRLLWKVKKESVEDALKKIERIKSLVIVAVQRDHVALSHAIKDDLATVDTKVDGVWGNTNQIKQDVGRIDTNIVKIGGQVAQTQKVQDSDMLMHVITWLTDLNFKSVQVEKLNQRVGDTGRWFLESEPFKKWVDGSAASSCLWCPGNPGVGKTILASIIVDYLRFLDHEKRTLVLSIFCDYQSAATQTIPNLLCSLLKQLVQDHGLSDPITSLYKQCLRDQTRPSLNTLIKTLSQELRSFYRVYIVLDALDEFTDDNQEELINTTRSLGDNVHLLVTSREIPKIGLLFKDETRLDIRAAAADINTFVMSKLSRGDIANLINGDDNLRQTIIAGVAEKAKGMFLLANLHMDSLAQSTTRKILRDALKELPDNMTNAYDETLDRVNRQGKHKSALANRIFGWITFARRPLTVSELRHALAVELGTTALNPDNLCNEDLLGSVCAGLVVMDRTYAMRFVHYTTQEYFLSRQEDLFPRFEETIMDTCLTYMSFNDFAHLFDDGADDNDSARDNDTKRDTDRDSYDSYDDASYDSYDNISYDCDDDDDDYYYDDDDVHHDLVVKHPFLRYSSVHWGYHASKLQHSMETKIITFLDSAYCRKAASIFHRDVGTASSETPAPLQFALDYGLLHIMEVLLNGGADPCQCKKPLLVSAIRRQNLDMLRLLLDRDNIDPNIQSSSLQRTPLSYAAEWGPTEVVEMLLQSGRVDANHKDCRGRTPLMMAVSTGDISRVKVLLKHTGIDILTRDRVGNPAYTYAYWQQSRQPDSSNNDRMIVLLEKYGGRPQTDHYEPTYLTADYPLNEQLNSNSGFRIPLDSSTTFPADDLTGPSPCHDTNGAPIYIGSAIFKKSIHPCKIGPHLVVPCSVPFGGRNIAHTGRYDLLPFNPDTMEFVCTSYGDLPTGRKLVKGGYEEDGTPLYHGVAVHRDMGIRIPGKTSHHLAGCNVTWGDAEHIIRFDYEILCWK